MNIRRIVLLVCLLASATPTSRAAEKGAPARTDPASDPLPASAVARLGTLRWAHGTEVEYSAYLPDGRQALTVDAGGRFRIWEKETGRLLRQFGNGDCKQLYWYVYDVNEKERVIDVAGNPSARHVVAVSADGGTVAISHGNGNLSLWDIATGKKLRTFKANVATTLAFTPDSKSLFSRGLDQVVRQYDVQTGNPIRNFGESRSGEKPIHCNDDGGLMVSPDGKTMFSIRLEQREWEAAQVSVRSWEVATGKELPALKGTKAKEGFISVAFSPQARLVAWSNNNGVIHVWDLAASRAVHHLTGAKPDNSGYYAAMAFSPDGKTLVARPSSELIELWDMLEGRKLRQFQIPKDRPRDFYTGNVAFAPDGSQIIAPGRAGTVRQFETASRKEVEPPVSVHRGRVMTLALSSEGRTAVTWSEDQVLHLWNIEKGTELKQVRLPNHIDRASLSVDGKVLALAGYGEKLRIQIWDAANLKVLRDWEVSDPSDDRLHCHPRRVGDLALSATGKRLAVRADDGSAKLWEVATDPGKPVKEYPLRRETGGHRFSTEQTVAFSPDGTLLAELEFEEEDQLSVRLWEVATGKMVRTFDIPQPHIRSAAVSPDGRTIAVIDADRSISLWEVASGKRRACLGRERASASPPDPMECIAFAPDGYLLAAGDAAGRVRLFDVTAARELDSLTGHIGPVVSLAFGIDSKRLTSGSADTTALIWELPLQPGAVKPERDLEQKQLEALWQDLTSDDAARAYQAIRVFRQFPKQVVPFVQTRVRPVEVDREQMTRLIGNLDDKEFATRQKAQKELESLGELAEDEIQKALDARPSVEVRRRLEALRSGLRICTSPPLDQLRALEALERIGTAEALQVVQTIARGTRSARLTRDAQATLERMSSKSK
jgi:WD40 repeat protein